MRSAEIPLLDELRQVQPFPYFEDSGVQVKSKLKSIKAKVRTVHLEMNYRNLGKGGNTLKLFSVITANVGRCLFLKHCHIIYTSIYYH